MKTTFAHDDDDGYWNEVLAGAVNWNEFVPPEFHQSIADQVMTPIQGTLDAATEQFAGRMVDETEQLRRSYLDSFQTLNFAEVMSSQIPDPSAFSGVMRAAMNPNVSGVLAAEGASMMERFGVSDSARRLSAQLSPDVSEMLMGGVFDHQSALSGFGHVAAGFSDLAKWGGGASVARSLAEEISAGARAVKISGIIHNQIRLPDSVLSSLVAKFDTWAPKTLSAAIRLAETEPEVFEAAKNAAEEHPDEVAEIASTLTGKPPQQFRGITAQQAVKLSKELSVALGTIFGATLSSPVIAVIAAILVFGLAMVELDMDDQEEIGGGSTE